MYMVERVIKRLVRLRPIKWIPLIIIIIVLPIFNVICVIKGENLVYNISDLCTIWYPISAVIWLCSYMDEYINGCGNELLYVKNHIKLAEIFTLYAIFMLLIVIPFSIYGIVVDLIVGLWIKMAILCYMYYGLVYAGLYITKSIIGGVVPVVVLLCNDLFTPYSYIAEALDYMNTRIDANLFIEGRIFIIIGTIGFIVGYIFNRYYRSYNKELEMT